MTSRLSAIALALALMTGIGAGAAQAGSPPEPGLAAAPLLQVDWNGRGQGWNNGWNNWNNGPGWQAPRWVPPPRWGWANNCYNIPRDGRGPICPGWNAPPRFAPPGWHPPRPRWDRWD